MRLHSMAVLSLGISSRDFWEMPFPVFTDLMYTRAEATRTMGMTRKELIGIERRAKKLFGWV